MNRNSFAFHFKPAAQALLLSFAFLLGGRAGAQNLLKNPGFDAPISTDPSVTTNWVVNYAYGGPSDFAVQDRTTYAARGFKPAEGAFGAQFRPRTDGTLHAYFKQTVSGLTPGDSYVVSGYMFNTWVNGGDAVDIYIEAVGGLGGVRTPNCTNNFAYTDPPYSVTNTARLSGTIEVRLHFNKPVNTSTKADICTGCFDNISLIHQ